MSLVTCAIHVQHDFSFNVVIKQPLKKIVITKEGLLEAKLMFESEFYLAVDLDSSGVVMQWQKGKKHQESPYVNFPSIWQRLRGYFQSVGTRPTDRHIGGKVGKDKTLANLSGNGHVKKKLKFS